MYTSIVTIYEFVIFMYVWQENVQFTSIKFMFCSVLILLVLHVLNWKMTDDNSPYNISQDCPEKQNVALFYPTF